MDNRHIGEKIYKLREIKGVSARDMSISLGQNKNYINSIENYKALPSLQTLYYICDYFEISIGQFFAYDITNPVIINKFNEKLKILNDDDLDRTLDLVTRLSKQ